MNTYFWKKALVIGIALTMTISMFSACGNDETSDGGSPQNSQSSSQMEEPTNLNFFNVAPKNGESVYLSNDEVTEFIKNYELGSSKKYYGLGDHYMMKGVTLQWDCKVATDTYKIVLADNAEFVDGVAYDVTEKTLKVEDLFVSTKYYWKIGAVQNEAVSEWSSVYTFKTLNSPRSIQIDGVSNTRDLGGLKTADGKYMKQGVVYRAAYLDEITQTGITQALDKYGIKTDLDLREPGDGTAGTGSPLGAGVKYINISAPWYLTGGDGVYSTEGKNALAEELRVFADAANYPILFHCSVGRDRTGTLAFLLQALCGASKEDIYMDYEMSFFSVRGCLDGATPNTMLSHFTPLYDYIASFGTGKTLAGNCEQFILSLGLTKEEISQIKANLLETKD